METQLGNRTFLLHGDECTLVKGHSFVERMQINMIFPAALHILYVINFLLLLLVGGGRGGGVTPLLHATRIVY